MLATEEGRRGDGEIRPVERLQGRELVAAELEDPLWRAQVLEPVLAEVAELVPVDERRARSRDENLPAVPGGSDACRAMDVRADVALLREQRRAGVETHPDRQLELRLCGAGGVKGSGRSRERNQERVALRVHLDAAASPGRLTQNAAVLRERIRIVLRAELLQEPRRPLDVGEEKGDRARREVCSHCAIIRPPQPLVQSHATEGARPTCAPVVPGKRQGSFRNTAPADAPTA